MRKTSRISAAFILIISLFIIVTLICGCQKKDVENPETKVTDSESVTAEKDPETTPVEDNKMVPNLIENGNLKFKLVRSKELAGSVKDAAADLYAKIYEVTGLKIEYSDDSYDESKGESADNDEFEILIGKTVRKESLEMAGQLKSLDYFVGVSGNKILVIGGSDESTKDAIIYFQRRIIGVVQMPDDGTDVLLDLDEPYYNRSTYLKDPITIAGTSISEYVVCTTSSVAAEYSSAAAVKLVNNVSGASGVALQSVRATNNNEVDKEIIVGTTPHGKSEKFVSELSDVMEYSIREDGGKLYINGGCYYALSFAMNRFIDEFIIKGEDVPAGYKFVGNAVEKNSLKDRPEGTNLRIMTNNVWNQDSNRPAWSSIYENCSAPVRAAGFAKVYLMTKPDVINFQEMSETMVALILANMKRYGLNYELLTFAKVSPKDFTCIAYNPETVKLLDSGHHLYEYGNNGNSKGYTWGYFELKSNGSKFVSLSTHLWYKGESTEPGSNELRRRQAAEIVAESQRLREKYDCPIFIQGDLNTQTTSTAFKELLDGGFEMCYRLATIFKDTRRGTHACGDEGFSTALRTGNYLDNDIDHMLVMNKGETEVLIFNHVIEDFYFKLSDHFPLYIDLILK